MSILSESISLRSWTKEKKTMPKQKNAAGKNPPKTKVTAIPRQAMRGVLRAREDGRQRVRKDSAEGGQYQEAAGLEERLIDDVASAGSSAAGTILRGSKRAVKRAAGQARQQATQPEQETSAPQDRVAPGGTNGAAPSSPARQMQTEEKRTTIKRQQERRQEHHFKNTARKQPRTAPSPKTAQALRQQAARTDRVRKGAAQALQRARRAAQVAQETAKRTAEIVRAGIKALWVAAHTLAAALAAGGMAVVAVILVICMVAMVAGSAFGIFFAAEPIGDGIGVTEAITELNGEYQERLQEIEDGEEYDRQKIEPNDGSYAIAWQDVLAVFASYVSGAEDGAPVAYLDEENLDRLRTTLWDMNEVDHRIEAQSHDVEVPDEEGNTSTETITETVLVIELTHRSSEEMRDEYDFNARQNEYLSLLLAEDTAPLWGELLGGFSTGGGEVMTPGSDALLADGRLQWSLPVPGTITSPQGYRTDPITGEVSYHSGTDIAVPEGTPILAAADGTVTIANGLDSWGGSYGYHVKLNHGGGLTTLYAHCSSICVTVGQQVKAGQVIAYVGHTGRAMGPHLHFEVYG